MKAPAHARTDREIQPCCGTMAWKAANGIESFGWSLRENRDHGCCSKRVSDLSVDRREERSEERTA